AQVFSSRMTVVLTHGFNSDPNAWASNVAALIVSRSNGVTLNVVAWDWSEVAKALPDPFSTSAFTPGEGRALGQALYQALGPTYNQSVHFIGHSLGTLVNAAAADYLHRYQNTG